VQRKRKPTPGLGESYPFELSWADPVRLIESDNDLFLKRNTTKGEFP
jgi:hypothetical protein